MNKIKELRFTSNIADNDIQTKLKQAEKFLLDSNQVKVVVIFKGRNIKFKERGELVLLKFGDSLKTVGVMQNLPKLTGNRMQIMLNPKKK